MNLPALLILMPLLLSSFSHAAFSQENPVVSPAVAGVELKSEGSLYWLHFDQDATQLWPLLKKFWENQGITLKDEQPLLGFMETEWITDPDSNSYRSFIFSDKDPEFREKFRLRIERLNGNTPKKMGSRVFIHHSSYGILLDEEAVYTGYLPSSPQIEIEMLSRLALFSGADKKQLQLAKQNYMPQILKATAHGDNQYEIAMPGSIEFVQKKLLASLDRIDASIQIAEDGTIIINNSHFEEVRNAQIEKEQAEWEIDDSSDLEAVELSAIAGADAKNKNIYKIKLLQDKFTTRISFSLKSGTDIDGLEKFSQLVAQHLNN